MIESDKYYDIAELLDENCMSYAKYVLTSRAIPDLRDGCKPIHRRILWALYKNKLTHDKPRSKSANAVGGVLAYSPHGDASVYDACVRLTNDSVNIKLIDGKGSFSSNTSRDVMAGASRYTEMRLAKFTEEMLESVEKDVVDMVLNYDESRYEPTVLPAKLPLILCNPNQGIGVGLSSSICSFNLGEVVDYTINAMNNKNNNPMPPDFPTGGEYIYDKSVLDSIDKTGRGSLKLRAKYTVTDNSIIITEIPYTTTREAICEKVIDLVKTGKLKEVSDINDYTGKDGLNITIDIKKNNDAETTMQKLFKMTTLENNFSCNFTVLSDGKPKVMGAKPIIEDWIVFRKECLVREIQNKINNLIKEKDRLLGLSIIQTDLDKAIAIIRGSKSEKEAMAKLISHFNLNQQQVEYICTVRLVNMNEEWLHNRTIKLNEMDSIISALENNKDNDKYHVDTITQQLNDIKKVYGKPRMTKVIDQVEEFTEDLLIEDYNCQIVVTEEGYLKKTNIYSDRQFKKPEDKVLQQISSTNKSRLLVFTNQSNCYYINLWEIDTTLPSKLGDFLPVLLSMSKEEVPIFIVSTKDYKGDMVFAFKNGKCARISLSSYKTKTNRIKTINAYNTNSKIVGIDFIQHGETINYLVRSSIDKVVVFSSDKMKSKKSSASQGVDVIKDKDGSVMVELKRCCGNLDENVLNYYRVNIPAIGKFNRQDI